MHVSPKVEQPPSIDLEVLEFHPAPIFVIRVSTTALKFELLYANQAFRAGTLRDAVLADNRAALLFRSWAQALGQHETLQSESLGWTWSAEVTKSGNLKTIRAAEPPTKLRPIEKDNNLGAMEDLFKPLAESREPIWPTHDQDADADSKASTTLINIPRSNLSARWKGIQAMMEMSDVGVFEYSTGGALLHANEAWYRLR
jgi:hypothetical protein